LDPLRLGDEVCSELRALGMSEHDATEATTQTLGCAAHASAELEVRRSAAKPPGGSISARTSRSASRNARAIRQLAAAAVALPNATERSVAWALSVKCAVGLGR